MVDYSKWDHIEVRRVTACVSVQKCNVVQDSSVADNCRCVC